MDPATTRGVVARLRERNLVSLVPDKKDKRKVMIRLEGSGKEAVQKMVPILAKIAEETMTSLNETERVALAYLLKKVANGL